MILKIILAKKLPNVEIYYGRYGLLKLASYSKIDLMINALVGADGMEPTVRCINSGVDIALCQIKRAW